ncbi:MAG: toll-Interleukin receptor [Proteobacteria bacterium SG_bin4]|nr:MAG: toll-Interleukin receptor [Proteobacteria bacterium SG_bin4]
MTRKIFISYSHKDESFRSDLEEHLSMLKRSGVISVWHDRRILAGDEWKGKIDRNLESADIVLFLISPSFLASDYCYDIEVKQAMTNKAAGKCEIISIIIRHCDWNDCVFSQFQAVPKDAKPINAWHDKDEAWLDAISEIKRHINEFKPLYQASAVMLKPDTPCISQSTEEWLKDTEISLTHRKINKINLDKIFVVPDVEYQGTDEDENIKIESAQTLLDKPGLYLISGEEQQGKTSLLKYYYKELLIFSYMPIYIDATTIKISDVKQLINKHLNEQYTGISVDEYFANANRVLLLDNIESLHLNTKYRSVFLENINKDFDKVIITCHTTFSYVLNEISALDRYKTFKLLVLGHKKREELIRKWLSLGQEESISDTSLYEQCDEIKTRLNIIIKRNIVPSKPIYVLLLLQMFEAHTQLKTDLTSYGHCYQQLVYQTFEKADIRFTDFEKFLNVLSELAWWILINDKKPNGHELDVFFEDYCKKYLPVNKAEVVKKLVDYAILETRNFETGFKYPYIYYFFAGKKIAESYRDSSEVRDKVKNLLELLYREDFANILIFVTHHTKDSWVLSEIKNVLASLFEECKSASLEKKQLAFMNDFMKKIPELVIEHREIQKERDSHNEKLDRMERSHPSDEELESVDIFPNINKTFKGMEIAGQIIRNRHASLTTDSMIELATAGINSGLRFLEYFINISDAAKNEIVRLIISHLSEQPDLTDQEIERDAEMVYMHITYGVISAVLSKIASSVGSKEALAIYEKLENNAGTPAASLIRLSIDLQFNKILNIDNVSNCANKLKGNPVCTRILKEMVIRHIYMFPVEYDEKQKLSSLLGISVKGQRIMDLRKTGKG